MRTIHAVAGIITMLAMNTHTLTASPTVDISAPVATLPTDTTVIDSLMPFGEQTLGTVEITRRKAGMLRMRGAMNGTLINREELFKAACCNLGESFTTNPSVDVSYGDAATGARQIKLLGLSGKYVQMLTETMPDFRGAAMPYSLGYVPGPWMKSIQVSKGSSSVRNGYESMTGQIDIEYLKPDDDPGATINVYGNTEGRLEANADANAHLSSGTSTEILAHYENQWGHHDINGDGFQDMPTVRQVNLQNRWKATAGRYMFHGGAGLIDERRTSGQLATGHHAAVTDGPLYRTDVTTQRYTAYMKHAIILSREHNASVALMSSASLHKQDAFYGLKRYVVKEKDLYTQLLFDTDLGKGHNIALGASLIHDYLGQHYRLEHDTEQPLTAATERETTTGGYAQYTFSADPRLTLMAGLRADHSTLYGTFVTPRLHIRWQPIDLLTLRISAGKGYRTPHALSEMSHLLASGRRLVLADDIRQESAWNYGISATSDIPLSGETLRLSAEYYYTRFGSQLMADYEQSPTTIVIGNVMGRSYSHTLQVDASYQPLKGMTVIAAYRRSIVRAVLGGMLREVPLTSRYKGLLSASYKTPLGLWQADVTLQLCGGGFMPTPVTSTDGIPLWQPRFKPYEQLSAQVTRWFKHFSVYIGGENLTGKRQHAAIVDAANPWGTRFDPTLIWGPVSGAMGYVGIRVNIGKHT